MIEYYPYTIYQFLMDRHSHGFKSLLFCRFAGLKWKFNIIETKRSSPERKYESN